MPTLTLAEAAKHCRVNRFAPITAAPPRANTDATRQPEQPRTAKPSRLVHVCCWMRAKG
jgi:hypothetical protein